MVSDSVVIRFLNVIAGYLLKVFYNSSTYRVLKSIASLFRRCFGSSFTINILKREGTLLKVWDKSKTYKNFSRLLHSPTKFMRIWFEKRQHVFQNSHVHKLIIIAADNLHVLTSLALFATFIIPHSLWYNIFATMMAFALLLLLFIKTIINKNISLNFKYTSLYLAIFVLSVLLAQIFSIFPGLSLRFLVFHLTCLIFVFVLVNSITSREQLTTVIESILMGVAFVGLYAIFQRIKGVPVNAAQTDLSLNAGMPGRVYSTMENPNNLAEILIMLIPFYVAVFLSSRTFIKKFIIFGMALPPLAALALTYSRSSWIGFAVAFLVFVILTNWRLVPLFILAGVAMIPVLPQTVYNRILTIFDTRDSSVGYRFLIYKTIGPMIEDYWFTGVGLGSDTFMKVVQNYPLHTKVIPPHTHNLFIQVWIETGLIGILSFLGFIVSTIKKGVKRIALENDKCVKYNIIAGISSLAGILTVGVAEYVWYYPRVMIIFWVVTGLLLAALNLQKNDGTVNE